MTSFNPIKGVSYVYYLREHFNRIIDATHLAESSGKKEWLDIARKVLLDLKTKILTLDSLNRQNFIALADYDLDDVERRLKMEEALTTVDQLANVRTTMTGVYEYMKDWSNTVKL